MKPNPLFHEEQKMPMLPWGIIAYGTTAFGVAVGGYGIYQDLRQPDPDTPYGVTVALSLLALAFLVGVVVLLLKIKLVSQVHPDGVYVRFIPFHRKARVFTWDQIASYEARTYSPLREYGGWGIRTSWNGKGMAYNAAGNQGVQLNLINGRYVMIGSRRAGAFAAAIDQVYKKS